MTMSSTSRERAAAPVLKVVRGGESAPRRATGALRFGDFQLDVESGELARDGEPVKLQPQPAKLLQYLAERSGRVVSRRELQVHLWGESRFVDSEQGLNYCVRSIRRALSDDAESPTYLETIPRRGYRFRVPVERIEQADLEVGGPSVATPAPAAAPPAASPNPSSRRWLAGLLLAAAAAAVGWALWSAVAPDRVRPPRLAVLPFEDLSPHAADAPLATGLAAELISRLVRENGRELGVIAQTSAMAFAGTRASVAEIGGQLDVDLLLTGTVQRAGEVLRVSTQLVEVAGETVRWAEVAERPVGDPDLEAWTAQVASAVAGELGLTPSSIPAFELPAELYEVYLEGVAFANLETAEGVEKGLAALAEVRRRAPGFAPAHLAWAQLSARVGSAADFLPEVMAALEQAVALDPDFAEAHLEITKLRGLYLYEWRKGAGHVRRALELRPRLAEAHIVHAMYLANAGRVDDALAAMHRALVIDPLSRSTSARLAWTYFFARRFEEAIEISRRTLSIDPASTAAHSTIIHSLVQLGDAEGALDHVREMSGRDFADLQAFWRAGAERLPERPGFLAVYQVQLGEHDAAIDSLLSACHQRVGWPLPFLRVDARFDALRRHPRWAEVLACTGLADE